MELPSNCMEHGGFMADGKPTNNGDLPTDNGDLPTNNADLPTNNGDLSTNNDFPTKKMGFTLR